MSSSSPLFESNEPSIPPDERDNVERTSSNPGNKSMENGIEKWNDQKETAALSTALRSSASKSPIKCPICLNVPENSSYADSCYHEFCYVCLLEWSKVKAECPMCKQKFKNIIHNIRSADDYDKYEVPTESESFGIDDAGQRFRFPTTMTVERVELLRLIRQLHLQMQEMQRNNQILQRNRRIYARQLARIRRLRHLFERSAERRERLTATSDFRRVVYERRLRSMPPGQGEPVRQSTPEFYAANPACTHRLVPWLTRELNVLMSGESGRVNFLMDVIRSMLLRWPINSPETRRFLSPYIGHHTDAFLHELHNFATSPYDMEEYDRRVQYESWHQVRARLRRPDEAPPEIVIGSSPEREHADDSVIIQTPEPAMFRNPSPPPLARYLQPNHDPRIVMLARFQRVLETNLRRLDDRRIVENARRRVSANLGRRLSRNGTIELLSSSSSDEDDDSPRLGPDARTPPYLLQSRKRKTFGMVDDGAKRRRSQAPSSLYGIVATAGESSGPSGYTLPFSPAPVISGDSADDDAGPSTSTSASAMYMRLSEASPAIHVSEVSSDSSDSSTPAYLKEETSSDAWSPAQPSYGFMQLSGLTSRSPSPVDPDEVQVLAELKPRHLRTPELVTVDEGEQELDMPSTSGRRNRDNEQPKRKEHRKHSRHHHHRHHKKKSKRRHRDERSDSRDDD